METDIVKVNVVAGARAWEKSLDGGREVIRQGKEVMGHENGWEEYDKMDRDSEREDIRQAVDSITRTSGQRPIGWYTRYGPSLNTRELVFEEGGFEYDCNAYNDDLPYYTQVHGKPWLVVPYSMEVNDFKYWRGELIPPNDFFDAAQS